MRLPKPLRRWLGWYTVEDLLQYYEQVIQARTHWARKTTAQRRSDIKHIRAALAGLPLKSVRPHHLAKVIADFEETGKSSVAQNLLLALRDLFNEALLLGWIHSNPALHVRGPRRRIKRQRLTLEQWRAVYAYIQLNQPPWVARAWVLALVTGQRCADLVKMQWGDVRDDLLFVEQQKKGARIAIPLALRLDVLSLSLKEAVAACREPYAPPGCCLLRSARDGHGLEPKTLSNYISQAVRGTGIPVEAGRNPPSLHEVRSLAARLYKGQGVNTQVLLGHKHASMTQSYHDARGLDAGRWQVLALPPTMRE